MASTARGATDDARRVNNGSTISPRPKTRGGTDNAKETLCRNVTIYGHCRFKDKGCAFLHDPAKLPSTNDNMKKRLNVDSPSFTPAVQNGAAGAGLLAINGASKAAGLSPKAASAAPFKPKGVVNNAAMNQVNNMGAFAKNQYNPNAPDWSMVPSASAEINEFLPQSHSIQTNLGDLNNGLQHGLFDPYANSSSTLPSQTQSHTAQINPYAQDPSSNGNSTFYQSNQYTQPLQYHLYASIGPYKEDLQPYQRSAHDFFIPEALREELQKKSAATLQILPNSSLPPFIGPYHSLVPLDTNNQKNATLFGYPSWIYKAVSKKNGNTYALRRLEGFRNTSETAILEVRKRWARINNGNVVRIDSIFTTTEFGDSSLIVVTDYHPLSKTLAETHLPSRDTRFPGRHHQTTHVTEATLWSYMVQITNALKAIHAVGLAVRIIEPSKIIVTSKNRIRLNACSILDIVQYTTDRPIQDLQREDLVLFGRLILALGTNTTSPIHNLSKAQEQFARSYSAHLKDRVFWLLNQMGPTRMETIVTFATSIEGYTFNAFDAQQQLDDQLTSELSRELENSRIARLMMKLGFINERPEYSHDRDWSETGERYPIKLFRDYVFHQVDARGNPVLDMAHVIACLNKLDAGTDERMTLTSRDDQIIIIVTYKEMKRAIDSAFGDLVRASRR